MQTIALALLATTFAATPTDSLCSRAVEVDPGCAPARYALGRFMLETPGMLAGSVSRSEAEFRAPLASDPGLTVARLDRARTQRVGRCRRERGGEQSQRNRLHR